MQVSAMLLFLLVCSVGMLFADESPTENKVDRRDDWRNKRDDSEEEQELPEQEMPGGASDESGVSEEEQELPEEKMPGGGMPGEGMPKGEMPGGAGGEEPTTDDCCSQVDTATPEGSVRLVGSDNDNEGRLEIFLNCTWGTVCNDRFSEVDATVACSQLGLPTDNVMVFETTAFGAGFHLPLALDEVGCTGAEMTLADCPAEPRFQSNCDHFEDVGVGCYPARPNQLN